MQTTASEDIGIESARAAVKSSLKQAVSDRNIIKVGECVDSLRFRFGLKYSEMVEASGVNAGDFEELMTELEEVDHE